MKAHHARYNVWQNIGVYGVCHVLWIFFGLERVGAGPRVAVPFGSKRVSLLTGFAEAAPPRRGGGRMYVAHTSSVNLRPISVAVCVKLCVVHVSFRFRPLIRGETVKHLCEYSSMV